MDCCEKLLARILQVGARQRDRQHGGVAPAAQEGIACIGSYLAVHPPSINIVSPVIREAACEARNTTAPAPSMGSPKRCRAAMRSTTSARNSGLARAASVPGVRMNVGATALTVMLCLPHSTARHFVRCAMAALVMQ